MHTLHIPLHFLPELTVQLRQIYNKLTNDLETGRPIDIAQLKATLMDALETQQSLGSGAFHRLYDQRSVMHLLHLTIAENRGNLLDLPWQLVAEGRPHLLVSKGLPDSDALPEYHPILPKPLKVLVMVSAPEGGGARLSYEAEEKVIIDALAPLMRTGEVEVEFTDDGSLESLRQSLANNRFHVLHFSGHGMFTSKDPGEAPEATLLLEDEYSMEPCPTSAADFAAVLSADPDRMPVLVLLSSCQTGMGSKDGGFRGAAQRLMQAGVPAVIAMGWSVADFWATHFARVFYEKIARRATLPEAFNQSLTEGRQVHPSWLPEELSHTPQDALQALFNAQSLIPQLFLTRQVLKLVDWGASSDKHLSRARLTLLAGKNRLADKLKNIHAVFGRPNEWIFIGRRRERKAALVALREGRSVLLKGQGGMGKTALALHLAQRRLATDSEGCIPFAFDQTSLSLENICHALLDFLETDCRLRTMRAKATAVEKLLDRFLMLLENTENQGVTPLFLLDNLETYQTEEGGGPLKPEALELLDYLITRLGYPVICTGRYPLQEFDADVLHPVDLNMAPYGDFRQKCLHLPALRRLEVPGRSFDETLRTLHGSLGGNYRSLEDFDELCRNKPAKAPDTLKALDDLIARYAGEALQNRAIDLVFSKLLALLTSAEASALVLLAQFNRPVLPFALEWQPQSPGEAEPLCHRLADLTLAERRTGEAEGRTYFFVPPLVRELLAQAEATPDLTLDDQRAGAYFEKMAKDLNKLNFADLEESFFHYERANNVEKVNDLGNHLSDFYYQTSQFRQALDFAGRTEALALEHTEGAVLNRLGMLFIIFGKPEVALHYLERSLADDRRKSDRQGEGTTLNNISQIHKVKGDYDTALRYLQQSMKIRQEIGDRQGEGATLNNLATTAHAKGDYDTALRYLQQSLKIQQEIGDRKGEGATLNNISQIYDAKGDYDTALRYLQQSLKISQEIGDRQGMSITLHNMALIYLQQKGDAEKFVEHEQAALQTALEIGNAQGIFEIGRAYGQFLCEHGDVEQGLQLLSLALQAGQQSGFSGTAQVAAAIQHFSNKS